MLNLGARPLTGRTMIGRQPTRVTQANQARAKHRAKCRHVLTPLRVKAATPSANRTTAVYAQPPGRSNARQPKPSRPTEKPLQINELQESEGVEKKLLDRLQTAPQPARETQSLMITHSYDAPPCNVGECR